MLVCLLLPRDHDLVLAIVSDDGVVYQPKSRTVDCWRTHDHRLDDVTVLHASFKNHLVDVTVECVVRQIGEIFDTGEIIVLLVRM